MGIFSRFSDIINANLNSLLDKAEDPEKIVRLMIQEMEDALVEVRSHAAKAIAERKERERFLHQIDQQAMDWQARAELAIRKGRDDLARGALIENAQLAERRVSVEREVQLITEQVTKLNDDIGSLQAKLADAKNRQRAILLKSRHADATLKVRGHTHSSKLDQMLERFEYAERRIDRIEAEAESLDLGRGRTIAQQIAELESEDKISAELEALKSRLAKSNTPSAE
jgi:phage shock protein A